MLGVEIWRPLGGVRFVFGVLLFSSGRERVYRMQVRWRYFVLYVFKRMKYGTTLSLGILLAVYLERRDNGGGLMR